MSVLQIPSPKLAGDAATQQLCSWLRRWRRQFGFPEDYAVFHVMTSGLDHNVDLVLEIGLCVVRDCQPIEQSRILLDWTREPNIEHDWLQQRLAQTALSVQSHNADTTHPFNPGMLAQYGEPPLPALESVVGLLRELQDGNIMLVAHNGWGFDVPFLVSNTQRCLGGAFAEDQTAYSIQA
jgi:DNA polymerase III epsilon subunit-like protein